jgi:opacity protein-like surface antigen
MVLQIRLPGSSESADNQQKEFIMKKIGLAASIVALMSSGALAADFLGDKSLKDDSNDASGAVMNWTGFYIGGSLGYGHANHNLSIHDYFKDYCDGKDDTTVGFDGGNDVEDTLANLNEGKSETSKYFRTSCESYRGEGTTPVAIPTNDVLVEGDSREVASIDGIDSSGLVGDGRIGFDLQRGRFVGGIFASYGFNDMSTDVSFGGTTITAIEKGDEWSIGARAGVLVAPRTLAYILAAYTESEFSFAGIGTNGGNKDVTFSGVTVGGGVEFALTSNVFLGVEGTHTFYGEEILIDRYDADENEGFRVKDEIGETKVMGTLKLKLNSGLPGLGN